jgi:hypothetical protein
LLEWLGSTGGILNDRDDVKRLKAEGYGLA